MTKKRFIFKQDGNFHTVIDTVENKPMGVFEFKENEFSAYACFHMIIDKMNELYEENQNTQAVLNDFINICNRLQANPHDEQTLNVARDMLQNMNQELKE